MLNGLSEVALSKSACAETSSLKSSIGASLLDGCERAAGLVLLTAAVPIIVGSAVVLGFAYRRFPLITHRRMGRDLAPFWMFKLRTMEQGGEPFPRGWLSIERITSAPDSRFKPRDDHRVSSAFAAFCRRHSIDELPQLIHVVSGRMSLVGPRPVTQQELVEHYGGVADEVFAVKPGLTGLWQVQGRSSLTMSERVALDLELVRSTGLWGRLRIALCTIRAVFSGNGAW